MNAEHEIQTGEQASPVYELTEFVVPKGRELEFEHVMRTARTVIARCAGLISIEYWRGVERRNVYTLLLKWRSMDAHLEEWRNSPHYPEWSALVVPFIVEPPRDEHFVPCGVAFPCDPESV
ncbi:heme-degrading monooxygenase HmoA [Kribbella aluminosa]|uniref:Heme-degrading monooxygenase HmoA n=1 Tax=Kribbella aluminosa TaxID=416017 RepID=A0ABS4UIG2_9ACTN|nr:antibiotic biosynthesis monooxygenase [Kribbella aluminosa]MBP2351440.1 heme-degrading monooxygenase HmoA [Kribbella aluminosa]